MDVQFIDELAANGRTPLHDALPWAKMAASAALLAASIAARTPSAAGVAAAAVVFFASASRGQLRHAAEMALYPVFFAGIFALGWIRSDPLFALTVVIRAFSTGLVAATLITTTPFVDIFAAISRVTPAVVSDALFMAYRSFFVLINELQDLLRGVPARRRRARPCAAAANVRSGARCGDLAFGRHDRANVPGDDSSWVFAANRIGSRMASAKAPRLPADCICRDRARASAGAEVSAETVSLR